MKFLDSLIDRMYTYEIAPHQVTPEKYNIPFQEVSIPASDGGALYGWHIVAASDAPTIILLHGWSRNLSRTLPYLQALYPLGYNLLAFDARNHGSSSRIARPTVGTFAEDVVSVVKFLRQQGNTSPIGAIGLSVGGGAVINAAGWSDQIRSVVTVGAISHPKAVMRFEFRKRRVPGFLASLLFGYMRRKYGLDFDVIAPVNNIRKSKAEFLLIHGEQDETVPVEQARALSAAGSPEKTQLWVIPQKGHSDCHTHPQFFEKVGEFFGRTLLV
ncbi:MAG TPA: alpha/beta fold hydrolase [Anaerolineales bacterium]|nr:alpha/beta fold hydrolase [Anaerolineales bacterium]